MAVTIRFYAKFFENLLGAGFADLDDETKFKCMLTTSSYTPDQDTHNDKADVTNEVSGTGYTAGGDTLTTTAITQTLNVISWDSDNAQWTSSTITARYAVIYDDTGATDADKLLVCYIDFGEDKSSENGTFELNFNASGIFAITAEDA